MPGASSDSSRPSSSSMATFFPDRVTSREHLGHSANGHSSRAYSTSSSPPPAKQNGISQNGSNGGSKAYIDPRKHPSRLDRDPRSSGRPKDEADTRPKSRSYQIIYDPELSKTKSKGNKPIYRYNGEGAPTPTDPRIEGTKRYTRTSKGKKGLVTSLPIPKLVVSSRTLRRASKMLT